LSANADSGGTLSIYFSFSATLIKITIEKLNQVAKEIASRSLCVAVSPLFHLSVRGSLPAYSLLHLAMHGEDLIGGVFSPPVLLLAGLQLLVPPISYVIGTEQPVGLEGLYIFPELRSLANLLDMGYSHNISDEGCFNPRRITHLFVHSSYNHLFANLQALLAVGGDCVQAFGTDGFYFLFFLGGYFAIGNEKSIRQLIKTLPELNSDPSYGFVLPAGGMETIFHRARDFVAGSALVAKDIIARAGLKTSVGSSGAISALRGASLVVSVKKLSESIGTLGQIAARGSQTNNISNAERARRRRLPLSVLFRCWSILGIATTVISEARQYQYQLSTEGVINSLLNSTASRVDYAAHLSGFLVGALAAPILLEVPRSPNRGFLYGIAFMGMTWIALPRGK
jgi:membrane associated rhomboid family serine protease